MKTLEELGISPTPWSENKWQSPDDYGHDVQDSKRNLICEMFLMQGGSRKPNASLIAAAPKLYEALREAIIEKCHMCDSCSGHPDYECENKESQCYVKKWRSALAEASGEVSNG